MEFLKGLYHNLVSQNKREKIHDYYKVIALLLLCLFWLLLGWMVGKGPPKGEGWFGKKEKAEEEVPLPPHDKPDKPIEYEGDMTIVSGGVPCPSCGLINLGCRIRCMRCNTDIPQTDKTKEGGDGN